MTSAERSPPHQRMNNGASTSVIVDSSLISTCRDGPAVSLNGSPTVSPTTAALCGSEPLPTTWPSPLNSPDSMYFLALSQDTPPLFMTVALRVRAMVPNMLRQPTDPAQLGAEEQEGGEGGRADRVSLGEGLRRVSHRVQAIGLAPDLLGLLGHLDDPPRVVGDGPERVHREDVGAGREHAHRGDGGAVEAGAGHVAEGLLPAPVGAHEGGGDHEHGPARALEADRETADDVGGRARLRRLRERTHRAVAVLGVVLRDQDEGVGGQDADDARAEQVA